MPWLIDAGGGCYALGSGGRGAREAEAGVSQADEGAQDAVEEPRGKQGVRKQ